MMHIKNLFEVDSDQWELFPDMPKQVLEKSSYRKMLVDMIIELREREVTTSMVSKWLNVPLPTVRGWVIQRHLPPEWMAKKLVDELRVYPRG